MNRERLALKGHLADTIKLISSKKIEAKGFVVLIRDAINPWETDVTKLKIDDAMISVQRLKELIDELKELESSAKEIEESLHG